MSMLHYSTCYKIFILQLFSSVPPEHINVIVTCTARKTLRVPKSLRMANVRYDRLDLRFAEWQERLRTAQPPLKKALDLYCGNAWSVIRGLLNDRLLKDRIRVWVISAGYGLISASDNVVPYAATFSPGHVDSVIPRQLSQHSTSEWWNLLIAWPKPGKRSIAAIAEAFPDEPLIVAASNDYLKAIAHDLELARSALRNPDKLVIIAAGASKDGTLSHNYLPCDSRLEHHVGKSRMSLNSRILKLVLSTNDAEQISASGLAKEFGDLLAKLPPPPVLRREASSDQEVDGFISENLRKDPRCSYTRLLRAYRAMGRACEQKRFRTRFRSTKRTLLKAK